MSKRTIIKIDEKKCTGCGLCIPNCPEGALQIIDGKARLISDLFCDGLGACIGHCPEGAITKEEREAEPYNEKKVMDNIIKQGKNTIIAHLKHLKEHNETEYFQQAVEVLKKKNIEIPHEAISGGHGPLPCGCPGTMVQDFNAPDKKDKPKPAKTGLIQSQLRQWPVQINLVPPFAPYLNNADLLIAADCVPFAYADFHNELLKGKTLLVGCPKLDDIAAYEDKFDQIFKNNNIKSVTYARMEVPCCFGMVPAIKKAIAASGKAIPLEELVISIKGEKVK
ncbi:MAG TPA: 4Fe-4S binding protein [Candidatus Omnitrophota bacterium]|nr:4Fe-4S binding protein [Candidatus Omnitrophota bacterium]